MVFIRGLMLDRFFISFMLLLNSSRSDFMEDALRSVAEEEEDEVVRWSRWELELELTEVLATRLVRVVWAELLFVYKKKTPGYYGTYFWTTDTSEKLLCLPTTLY